MRESLRAYTSLPIFQKEGEEIRRDLSLKSVPELQRLWKCSQRIAEASLKGLQSNRLSPTLFRFDGVAFVSMDPDHLDEGALRYLDEHLRIFSAVYGLLRPMDGIPFYRMDYGSDYKKDGQSLSSYYGKRVGEIMRKEEGPYINLASQEYFSPIRPYLPKEEVIDFLFYKRKDGKLLSSSVQSKQCRGALTREMAIHKAKTLEDIKRLTPNGFVYLESMSTPNEWVYVLEAEEAKEKRPRKEFDW